MKKNEILNYLKENTETLREMVSECNCYDGSLEDYYYWENDEYFFRDFFYDKVDEAVRAVCYGDYRYMDDYVKFNDFGNLDSCSEYQLEKELQDNVEEIFDIWYELYQGKDVSTSDDNLIEMIDEMSEGEK